MDLCNESKPKVFSFFLVEDQVNPYNIYEVFNEVFGSEDNYKLDNARSVFSAVVKLNYCLKKRLKYNLYIFDVRLSEKEDKKEYALSFHDENFHKDLNCFYNIDEGGFSTYEDFSKLDLDVFTDYKKSFGKEHERENMEGLYLWAYTMKHSLLKFRSVIYSASSTSIQHIGWIKESGLLAVLEKSLFTYHIKEKHFDALMAEIERLAKGKPVQIYINNAFKGEYNTKAKPIPECDEEFVDDDGDIIEIDKEISYVERKECLEIHFQGKEEIVNKRNDYSELLKVFESCSHDILADPNEKISWDNITREAVDGISTIDQLYDFLAAPLGIHENKYWTLRTLFPAQCYRILTESEGKIDEQKKHLKDLIGKYGWNDYAEEFALFFNRGLVKELTHSCESFEEFKKNNEKEDYEKSKKKWEAKHKALKALTLEKIKTELFSLREEPPKKKKTPFTWETSCSWETILEAFEKPENENLKELRTYYLEYKSDHLFDSAKDGYYIRDSNIVVKPFGDMEINYFKLFLPGKKFLTYLQEVIADHNGHKSNGEIKECILKHVSLKDALDRSILSFILPVYGFKKKSMRIENTLTYKFWDDPLLHHFVRFHLGITRHGEKEVWNINNRFPVGRDVLELKVNGQVIVELDTFYDKEDIDEVYIFSITSAGN